MPAVALYRDYDLPWTPSADDERRLRRVLGAVLGLLIAFGIVMPLCILPRGSDYEKEKS